jgi:iron complex transport system ATP-binding protein
VFNLRVQEVALGYGNKLVLKDVSLEANPGELVGLVGPNGSGKSTLIKAISGVLPSRSGKITLNGQVITRVSRQSLACLVAVVPQNPSLPEAFTALEIVLMGRYPHLGLLRYESERDLATAWNALEAMKMEGLAQRRVNELSGGERQRLLIARALAQEPEVILLDEPTAHLDFQHQLEVMELVQGLAQQGKVAVAAIHDFSLAARFCHRLVLLRDGTVGAEGPPEAVITARNIEAAFGVKTLVYTDPLGSRLIIDPLPKRTEACSQRIHIIGGGGRAARLMRMIHSAGFELTAGVLNEGDTDYNAARALGIEVVAIPPFASIDERSHRLNLELVAKADCTVVADVPFGHANLLNLEAAAWARRLVLIEESCIESRDFAGGKAKALYQELKGQATTCMEKQVLSTLALVLDTKGQAAQSET